MTTSRRSADRSGLVLDTHDLGRRAGSMREVVTTVEAPEGLGNDVIGVPPNSPIELDLRLEAVVEGVLVTGVARAQLTGECGRCLRPIEDDLEIDLQELFLYPDTELDDEEASRIVAEQLDLEPLVRDQVVLELPFMPLCRPDCAGLCPQCGADLNDDPEHSHGDPVDPRWGDLAALRTELEQRDN
ncbi:YceD family protein [Granulicoccus phenolivorans]|uniref:YceD family protein n=1 Tax=Granulicoccus phenolivorans TaxID=266854 RepID=UPI0004098193|nr:YceD family protein [Granulicoccus phenolivorans]